MGSSIQQFLDEMYQKFIPLLAENVLLVPDDLPKLTDEEDEIVQQVTWRPVAIEVIVTVLDPLVESRRITKASLYQRISDIDFEKLGSECGLTVTEAGKAVRLAVDLLSEEENLEKLQNIIAGKQT